MLNFQVEEIFAARLRPGEDTELENERRRLGNAEALTQLAQAVQTILTAGESELPSAIDLVGKAVGRLEKLSRIDPEMQAVTDEAQGLLEQLSDLARSVQDYADQIRIQPGTTARG